MPAPNTEMQQRFAVEYALNGGHAQQAAVSAGYSEKSAKDLSPRTLALPHVAEMVLQELTKLRCRSGAVGVKALVEIAENSQVTPAARVSAARALMEHAGMLGTAKELREAREVAQKSGEVIDYKAVLDVISSNARQDKALAA